MEYNKTQLHPEQTFERHVFHRDQFAHFLRFCHIMKIAESGSKILDVGCGNGNIYEVFYRNRYSPARYVGVDIRKQTIDKNIEKFPKAEFICMDICKPYKIDEQFDVITSFEVIEHIGKSNGVAFLENIANNCSDNTVVYLSTPNYDAKVGAAENHIINGEVGEYTQQELITLLDKFFDIKKMYGTFASKKDIYGALTDPEMRLYDKLSEYYDSNLMSVLFAPLYPEKSRNILYVLTKKHVQPDNT